MSRIPRLIGYGFMAAAALLAAVMKKEGLETIGPLPAVAALLFLGMVGVMLIFTDLMVRGLYAQVDAARSEEHTSELQSLMRISYAVFCLKKKRTNTARRNKSSNLQL